MYERLKRIYENTGINGFVGRLALALLISFIAGLSAVVVDIDHVVCAVQNIEPWNPQEGQFGCRLWHSYLLPVGLVGCSAGITLLAGLCGAMVVYATRPTLKNNNSEGDLNDKK